MLALLALCCAGCVTPLDRYVHPAHDEAYGPYDWRCTFPDGSVTWANDRAVHAMVDVLTDPGIVCVWKSPAEVCAGAPAEIAAQCRRNANRP